MIWYILLVIAIGLSVPYWLGIVPEKLRTERRFLARATLSGLAAGALFNAVFTLMYRNLEVDPSQFLVIANGGALGAIVGLVGMFVIHRRKVTVQSTPSEERASR